MSEVLQANIFFFITGGAVILVTLVVLAILFYVLAIVRNVKNISDRLNQGSETVAKAFSKLVPKGKKKSHDE